MGDNEQAQQDETDRVMALILSPDRVPADRLGEVSATIVQRLMGDKADAIERWRIRLTLPDGREIVCDEDDYPLVALEAVEKDLGRTWHQIAPGRSARDSLTLIRHLLAHRTDIEASMAHDLVDGLTVGDVLDRFETYTREAGPFAGSARATG